LCLQLGTKQKKTTVIASTSKKNILVIEDHDSIRWLLGRFLGKKHNVTTARDGWEAMAWLGQGNIPDLILLDLKMPRIGGSDFLKNIKTSGFFKDIPVIVLSGNEDDQDVAFCYELGANEFVAKPFNPIILNQKINAVFNTSRVAVG
jgi:CheY-like chemotaxis protein